MDWKVVESVARIAHLSLTECELEMYSLELKDILDYFEILDEAPEMESEGFNPIEIADVLRSDIPEMEIPSEDCLRGMMLYDRYIKGPRLI
ncbi:MAG: aspartyl/glutamyl-tRNA amidotransferase subunit C [archaeon]|nr:aspartyl/glutamyl-tRNA amidotransferase subunit C [archaeon]